MSTQLPVARTGSFKPGSGTPDIQLKRKTDIFDDPNFEPIKFINNLYPDESSLTDLDKFVGALKKQITAVDKEIFNAVRIQGGAHTRARQELEAAQCQLAELAGRITSIQRKAEESETMVQEICRDIRKLDYAKQHLTNGITALRRLAMLTAAVSDLESCSTQREQYKKSANLLEAVHQLLEYFQQYEDIPKVKSLSSRVAVVEHALATSVLDDFKVLMGTVDIKVSPDNLDRLAAGCLVIDALGPRIRDQLLDWLCDREMNIYQLFSQSGTTDVSKLDRFDRRFHWFRTRMEERKAEWAIFPEQWRVPQLLCLTFCKITKAHLKRVLSDDEGALSGLKTDISPLIKAVVATNAFEKQMAGIFGGGTDQEDDEGGDPAAGLGDEVSASEARKRLERMRQQQKSQEARRKMDQLGDKARAEREAIRTSFEGAISEAFESVLHLYVSEEEKELLGHLDTLLREEAQHGWLPTEDEVDAKTLPSANKLFLKIRASLTRCVKMISKGQTLLSLTKVFQRLLSGYCQALHHRLPKTHGGQTSVTGPLQGTDWHIKLSLDDERVVCHILHTANFCCETLEALAAAVVKDIKKDLAEQVDMDEYQGAFQSLSGACMSVLALGINTRLDAGLQELGRVRWDVVESPGDDSVYVNIIRKTLLEVAPRLGQRLDTTTLVFLSEKTVRTFVTRFQEVVGRARKVSDKGTLQLSIDCDAVKRVLHDFPKAAMESQNKDSRRGDMMMLSGGDEEDEDFSETSGPFASYHSYVERELGSTINMVKVLQSKPENLVDTFLLLMPANNQSIADFARICEMKGLSRQHQQQLLQAYQTKAGGGGQLDAAQALAAAALPASGLAANLGAFRINMDSITALASNINFPKLGAGPQPGSPSAASGRLAMFNRAGTGGGPGAASGLGPGSGQGGYGGGSHHSRNASIGTAAETAANRAKETFAKVGTFMGTGFSKIGTAFGQQHPTDGH